MMRRADVAVDGPVASCPGLGDVESVGEEGLTCFHSIDLDIAAFAFVVPNLGYWS